MPQGEQRVRIEQIVAIPELVVPAEFRFQERYTCRDSRLQRLVS